MAAKKYDSFPTEPPAAAPRRQPPAMDWREIARARWHLWLVFALIVIGGTFVYSWGLGGGNVPEWKYNVVNVYPHDPNAFTQGLHYYQGHLYESTGLEGFSSIRKVELETGKPLINIPLDPRLFGEGLTMIGDQIYQITWKSGVGFVYNLELQQVRRFDYTGQGWGLTYDGQSLIMSDGATVLRYFDPVSLQETKQQPVYLGSFKLDKVNEMEFVDGFIFANRWQQDVIYVIDPRSGRVRAKIPLANLLPSDERPRGRDDGSLNGIAYNPESKTFYITGKKWPKLFEIEIPEFRVKSR